MIVPAGLVPVYWTFSAALLASAAVPSALAAAPILPAPAPLSALVAQVDIPYQQFTLANGLQVIVHSDRKAPVVAVSVWYRVGSKYEPAGKTGFAHLFEHLMFNGSEDVPGDFFVPLKQIGATDYNGTTSFDRTNYFETVPAGALDRALYLESDRMGHLTGAITQEILDEQRGVVQNEKRQGDNQPYGMLEYRLTQSLFPADHPYGHTTIGSMADLDTASLADVKNWFAGHYGPNNAVLVLAGDVDLATARALVEKNFGAIPRGASSVAPAAAVPTLAAPRVDVMKDRVAAPLIVRAWAVPGLNDPDSIGLDIAAGVLGGLASSRLDNALVRGDKLAVSVSAENGSYAQVGTFTVQAVARPGVDPQLLGARLDAVIADFLKTGPTADEVRRYATRSAAATIAGLESVGGFGGKAATLAEGAVYSGDPAYYRKQLTMLAAATPASVRAAAVRWLSRPVYALTVEPGARDQYDETHFGEAHPAGPGALPAAPATASAAPAAGRREAAPPVGAVASLAFPAVTRARLTNGIELIYAQRTAVPITRVVVSFDAGVAADVAGRLGTQKLTLDMLREGTTSLGSIALAEAEERLGASLGAGASLDRSFVSLSAPSVNLSPAVALLADVTRHPAFEPAEVGRVRNQQLAEIAQELTNPAALAGRVLPALIYGPASPYAKSDGAGDPKAVAALTPGDLAAFHHAWLRPDKAKIFVVSDLPLAAVRAVLDAGFGDWQATGPGGTKVPTAPGGGARPGLQPAPPHLVLVDRPQSPQSLILAGIPTALAGTGDMLPVLTANDVLGGSFLSRINMDLREGRHWSYGVSGTFQRSEHAAPYLVKAPVQADKTGASITALRSDIAAFLTTAPITVAEFDRTIAGATRSLAGEFETSTDVLTAMEANDLFRRSDDYDATLPERYRGLTRMQLDAAARGAIDPARAIWVVVGDAAVVRPQLNDLALPITVISAAAVAGEP